MKVILQENVKTLGKAGETVSVAEGYGRNYLLPNKLAVSATPENLRVLEQKLNSKKGRERRAALDARELAEAIAAQPVKINAHAGEAGKLFGSVTSADIEKALAERGLAIEKKKIELEEPIKALGTYTVEIRLHPDVVAKASVLVEADPTK